MSTLVSRKRVPAVSIAFDANGNDGLVRVPPYAYTLAGFRRWVLSDATPEKLKVMYLRGEVFFDMSKEEIKTHALVKTAITGALWTLSRRLDFGHLFINGVLFSNKAADVSNNPDIVMVSWDAIESGRVRYVEHKDRAMEVAGSPDLVIEIVSDSSVKKDTRDLREAYHQAGIKEYWLIDARGADIVFQILTWRKAGFVAGPARGRWNLSPVLRHGFRLTRKRDRADAWKYTLSVKSGR